MRREKEEEDACVMCVTERREVGKSSKQRKG